MSRSSRVELDPRAIAKLADLPEVRRALEEMAEAGAADARRRVPVDTGRLRDGIRAEATEDGARWGVEGVPYADDVEFGTFDTRAQPFLRPSIDSAIRGGSETSPLRRVIAG
jgi:HK97 gp10 family phage protein